VRGKQTGSHQHYGKTALKVRVQRRILGFSGGQNELDQPKAFMPARAFLSANGISYPEEGIHATALWRAAALPKARKRMEREGNEFFGPG
jgi:hypothetical protein